MGLSGRFSDGWGLPTGGLQSLRSFRTLPPYPASSAAADNLSPAGPSLSPWPREAMPPCGSPHPAQTASQGVLHVHTTLTRITSKKTMTLKQLILCKIQKSPTAKRLRRFQETSQYETIKCHGVTYGLETGGNKTCDRKAQRLERTPEVFVPREKSILTKALHQETSYAKELKADMYLGMKSRAEQEGYH